METYVVRVYRRPDEECKELLGMVEIVEGRDSRLFTTLHELVDIISVAPRPVEQLRPNPRGRRHDD